MKKACNPGTGVSGLLTTREAAKILGISEKTLNNWRCTDRYPLNFYKIGRCVRYRLDDIEEFISNNLVPAA